MAQADAPAPSFAVDAESIPPEVYGLTSYVDNVAKAPRMTRATAIQVPAVKRSRDLVCSTLGGLPLDVFAPTGEAVRWPLLEQPEKDVPRSVTMTRTFEDMFFEGRAWWRFTEFGWHNYPTRAKRIDPRRVTVDEDRGRVYIDGKHVPNEELARFDAPTDGLLIAGARAIRTALTLDAAAGRYADGAPPLDYFTPAEDGLELEEDDVQDALDKWAAARRARSTGYVPSALKYNEAGWNPEQLQLADARQHAVLEIARAAGVDPEELGVSTTSRTYANQQDRRKTFLDFTLGQYRQAVEDRLSMGDVTPRGYTTKVNLSAFLRTDDKTRVETAKTAVAMGLWDLEKVRAGEGDLAATGPAPQPQTAPAEQENTAVDAHQTPEATFDTEPAIRLDAPQSPAHFEVDAERRVIRGLAVPYGVVGLSGGERWQFAQGTIKFADVSRVKLWVQHDQTRAVGVATKLEDRPEGLFAEFRVARGAEGDRALELAEDGVLDGLSIGLRQGGRFSTKSGVNHAVEAPLMEVSLTPAPSFDDARVHGVAASAAGERNTMKCTKCGIVHPDGVTACNPADVAAFEASNGPTFDAQVVADAIRDGFANISLPPRETVDPTGAAGGAGGQQFQVDEAPLYRFDGVAGQHSLTDDMRGALYGDSEARGRIDEFFNEQFAVTTGNVGTLNPTQNRPDLFVPNLTYTRPLWDMVTTGTVDDKTPFTIPKFANASLKPGTHTEGVEPTPGSASVTSQTVTPKAISGKVEINREVLDQGGSPQADQIIFNEMLQGYYEAIEERIAALLNAVPTTELNLGSAVDAALIAQFTGIMAGLQFVRGGNRFTGLALDGTLFPKLVDAKDSTGRALLPVYGPTNAQGETSGAFDRVSIGGLTGRAAWALGSGNAAKSHLFVPSSVYAWASAPRKFEFQYQLKSVDIGIWGYGAEAVTRDSDVRPIDYTVADA